MNWYIIYTTPRSEKKVAERLEKAGFEYYLPLTKKLKQWSDRRKIVEEPLFNSYIFIKINLHYKYDITHIDGVIKFVSFRSEPAMVPDREIDLIKRTLEHDAESVEVEDLNYKKGQKIIVNYGPMIGYTGEVVNVNNIDKLIVRLEGIHQSLIVNIQKEYIEKNAKDNKYIRI